MELGETGEAPRRGSKLRLQEVHYQTETELSIMVSIDQPKKSCQLSKLQNPDLKF